MLLTNIILLFILKISSINSFSLMYHELDIAEDTNIVIHATLKDEESSQVWTMVEKISKTDKLKGKIDITSSDGQISVFYSSYDIINRRLVMHDNECHEYIYTSDWKPYLPGIKSKYINQILLTGPSLFYQFADSEWSSGKDAVIRGIKMHSVTTEYAIFKITLYYKTGLDQKIGVKQPSRILLGILNDKKQYDMFMLDIYFISQTTLQLDGLINPTPGIGCSRFINEYREFPLPRGSSFHIIFEETINESKRFLKEIHADEALEILRSSEIVNGSIHNYVYDHNLGVSYHIEPFNKLSSCSIRPIELTDPGVDVNGKFSVSELLWLEGDYNYLGDVYYEHRSNFKTLVWESVDYNKALPTGKYDKVVTTQYLIELIIDNKLVGYKTIGATRNAYNKESSGKFILVDSIRRNYYTFGTDSSESAYHEAFQISDCFPNSDQRLTLTFILKCEETMLNTEDCTKGSEDSVYELRQELMDEIVKTYEISFLRIADVVFVFTKDSIKADVTFLEAPSFTDSFKYTVRYIDMKSIKKLTEGTTENDVQCLRDHSRRYESPQALVYCENDKACISTTKDVKTAADGIPCKVYEFPVKNLHRFGNEVSLRELHDTVVARLHYFIVRREHARIFREFSYKIVNIIETNEAKDEQSKRLFNEISSSKKLTNIDGMYAVSIPEAASFGDCYRTCARSEEISCEIFTFCQNGNEKQCILTNMTDSQSSNHLTTDKNCKTFSKSHLSDYSIQRDMKFKQPVTTPNMFDLERCASACFNSEGCFSFEYSEGFCSFGGYFSEENVEPASDSNIYILKASRKYGLTGSMVVSEVLHTRLGLDIDQCATLCDDWESKAGEVCKSFNFCPRGRKQSACQLTAYSVQNQQTLKNQSDICHNFEIIEKPVDEENSKKSRSAAFEATHENGNANIGYAFLLLIVGLLVGFSTPCLVIKVKSSRFIRSAPSEWMVQVNNDNL